MKRIENILIVPNPAKDEGLIYLHNLIETVGKKAKLYIDKEYESYNLTNICFVDKNSIYSSVDMILVLGGDGTLLSAADDAAPYGVPIMGINLGHLGFLAEVEKNEATICLEKLFSGDYIIEERMMINAQLNTSAGEIFSFDALNDIVVTKGALATLMDIDIFIGDEFVDDFKSDGIIISTPTGSTAYSLSAGGAIVSPDVCAFAVTPICPHKLYSRPMIVSDQKEITIKIRRDDGFVAAALADGRKIADIKYGDIITVTKSKLTTKLIRLSGSRFYSVFRHKLMGKVN